MNAIMKYKTGMILGCLAATLLVTGCNPQTQQPASATQQQENTFDRVQKTGMLRTGYFLMEPMIMRDRDGKLSGEFIDIVEQIAKDMRWKVEYKQVDLKNFAAAIQAGEF